MLESLEGLLLKQTEPDGGQCRRRPLVIKPRDSRAAGGLGAAAGQSFCEGDSVWGDVSMHGPVRRVGSGPRRLLKAHLWCVGHMLSSQCTSYHSSKRG